MSLSNFKWVVVHEDGTTDTIVADCIEEVVRETDDEQPIAIIRG